MIKASELRKGIIIIDYTGHIREVAVEDIQQQCWHEEGQTGTTEAPLNSIPLTPEWLERCGFEAFNREGCYVRKYHAQGELMLFSTDSSVAQANDLPAGKFYYMFGGVAHFIDYVHQLQNLYFALTGEELNVKL